MLHLLKRLFGRSGTAEVAGSAQSPPADPLAAVDREDPALVRLLVGLGNPGQDYAQTRHNLGFVCLDQVAHRLGMSWLDDRDRTASQVAHGSWESVPIVLAKPHTFMNRSGSSVCHLLERLHLAPSQVLVIYDDMDLPIGTLRMRERGSAGTHNGMRSVVAALGTDAVPRLRIGISQAGRTNARDYVLSPFSEDEQVAIAAVLGRAADAALTWAVKGAAVAMNRYNS